MATRTRGRASAEPGDGHPYRRLTVVVPVYNERDTVAEIVRRLRSVAIPLELEVIVVDDGSSDGTRSVLAAIEDETVRVVHHDRNRGKGAAIRTGLASATGDLVLVQDADLEYDPGDIPRLIEPVLAGRAVAVYGSRFHGGHRTMSAHHRWGNRFLSLVTNLLYGSSLSDMETCYKLVDARLIRDMDLRAERFDFEPEVTSNLLRRGVRILEVPISYEGREIHEGKKISWRDGFAAVGTLLRVRFRRRPRSADGGDG